MDARSTRPSRWATRSSPKRFPPRAGRNGTTSAWVFVPQGCVESISDAPLHARTHGRHPDRRVHAEHHTVARNRCENGVPVAVALLYSAFLAASLEPATLIPLRAQDVVPWEGAEARLRAAHERVHERAKAGQTLPQSSGILRAGARLLERLREPKHEPALLLWRGWLEAWLERSELPGLSPGEHSGTQIDAGEVEHAAWQQGIIFDV